MVFSFIIMSLFYILFFASLAHIGLLRLTLNDLNDERKTAKMKKKLMVIF